MSERSMRVRIVKVYELWAVEFPFAVVVYCQTWAQAVTEMHLFDAHLARSMRVAETLGVAVGGRGKR